MKQILLLIAVGLFGLTSLFAQGTCLEQLNSAQRNFDDGLLDDIPEQLAACMKDGFTKEERANAYKLLMQTYLFSEQIEKADKMMIEFLAEFPAYTIADNDPKEFINLYNTYRTDPIFKIETTVILSYCIPLLVQPYGPTNVEKSKASYTPKTGFAAEVNYIETIDKSFSYSAGVSFAILKMGYYNKPFDYTAHDYSTVEGDITNMYVGVPLAGRYNYSFGRIDLFAKAGIEPVYLLYSSANLTRTDVTSGVPFQGDVDFTKAHKRLDFRPFIGLGMEVDLGRDQLILSFGYKSSLFTQLGKQQNKPDLDPNNPSNKLLYEEDNLYLNQATFSFSYIRPIYKPKKIR